MLRVYENPPGQAETAVHTFTLIPATSAETEFDVIKEVLINARAKFSVEEAAGCGGSGCDSEMSRIIAHMKLPSNNPYISEKPTKLVILRLSSQRLAQLEDKPRLPHETSSQASQTPPSPSITVGATKPKVMEFEHMDPSTTTSSVLPLRYRTNRHIAATEQPDLSSTGSQTLPLPPQVPRPIFSAGEIRALIPPSGIKSKAFITAAGIKGQKKEQAYLMPVIVAVARMEGGKLFPRQIPDISTRLSTTQPLLVPPSYLTLTDPMMATQMEVKLGDLKQSPKFQALRSARMVDYVVGKQGSNERSYKLSADAWQEAEDWAIQRNLLGQTDMRVLWPDKALQIANEAWKAAELAKKTNGIVDIWKKDREEFEGWDVDGFMGQVWPGKRKRSSRPGAHTGYESGQVWKVEVTRPPVLYSAAMGDMTTFGNERSLIATPNNFLNREFDGAEAGPAGSHVGPLDPKEEGSEYRTEKIADVQADAEIVKLSEGEDMYGAAASRTDIFADENDDVTRDEHEVGDADPPSNPTSAAIGEDVDQLTARTGQLRTDTDEYSEEDEVEGVVEGEPGVSQEASVRDESLHTTATSTEATGVEEPGVGLPDDIESLTVNELSGAEEHDVEQPGKNAPSVGHDESATEESDKIVSDKQAGRFILHVGDFSWSLEEELFAKESAYFEALLRGSFKEARTREVSFHDELPADVARMISWVCYGRYDVLRRGWRARTLAPGEISFCRRLVMGCKSQCSEYWAEQAVRSMLSIGPPMDIYYWAVHEEYRMLMFADAYMMPRLVQYSVDRMFNLAEERPYLLWDIRDMMQLSKIGQELVNDRFCDAVARRIDYFADEPRFAKLVKDHPDTVVQIIKAIASQKCSESSSTNAEPLTRRKNCEQTRELEGWDKLGETWFFFPGVGVKPGENHMRTLFGMPPLPEP